MFKVSFTSSLVIERKSKGKRDQKRPWKVCFHILWNVKDIYLEVLQRTRVGVIVAHSSESHEVNFESVFHIFFIRNLWVANISECSQEPHVTWNFDWHRNGARVRANSEIWWARYLRA